METQRKEGRYSFLTSLKALTLALEMSFLQQPRQPVLKPLLAWWEMKEGQIQTYVKAKLS